MCAVSAIVKYGMEMKPTWIPGDYQHRKFQKLLDAAKEFDTAVHQEECVKGKEEVWLKEKGFYS